MSDTRRRRKSHHSGASDDLSDSYDELNATKETQSSEQTEAQHDSEYDTAGSDTDTESQDGALRESGDGQEEDKPQRKLDDDEDRRNPQYIPKRGTFYEHDDRTADEVTDTAVEPPSERETKEKKVWKDKEDRWNHDRYNDEEQAPKSHEELIAVYGYDIRNEEGPPRARRRRRYGRGPNKYTRNWEDEDAYGKTAGTVTPAKGGGRKSRGGEEFPALGANNSKDSSQNSPVGTEEPVITSAWYSNKNKSQSKVQDFPPLQSQSDNHKTKPSGTANLQHTNENRAPNEPTNPAWKKEPKNSTQNQSPNRNSGGGDADKSLHSKASPRDVNKRHVQESVSLVASRVRGRGFKANANNNAVTNRTMETKPKGRGAGPISAENRRNNTGGQHDDDQQLVNNMKHMNVNDGAGFHQGGRQNKNYYSNSSGQQRPSTVPPRMQQQSHQQQQQSHQQQQDASGNRPKRYSSLRQRPAIPEGPGQPGYQPQHGQHGYYPPQGGNTRAVLESSGPFEQTPPVPAPAAPMAAQPVIPLPPGGQAANYAPPAFLVPSPQFMPPQSAPPSIINYVSGPNGPTFQPNYQGYQGYNPTVQPPGPPPPQELFQPQGCTYYSPAQQQQQQQQAAPIRRPKAAIPILPPPDNQQHQINRGRGRIIQQQQQYHSNLEPGNVQHTEAEGKVEILEGDQAVVPGQFDNAQGDQLEFNQQYEKIETPELVTSDAVNEESACAIPDEVEKIDVPCNDDDAVQDENKKVRLPTISTTNDDPPSDVTDNNETISTKSVESEMAKPEAELCITENKLLESSVIEEAAA
ncbi:protein CASC3 isoform X2 [Cephus cinctus]|uniref:Protein CASC3 n=1 Tax=Cephus cinctus TaxID=211228 RepID=A0AAJ7C150_CEPCN|nr:protein CASC3 isoform X2 [Cephus cinctus]